LSSAADARAGEENEAAPRVAAAVFKNCRRVGVFMIFVLGMELI